MSAMQEGWFTSSIGGIEQTTTYGPYSGRSPPGATNWHAKVSCDAFSGQNP